MDFLAGLYRQKLESKTVARNLVSLRNFFRFAQVHDAITDDPAANLESPKIRKSLPGYLRLEEVEKLLAAHQLVNIASDPFLDLVAAEEQRMEEEGLERRIRRRYAVWGDVPR